MISKEDLNKRLEDFHTKFLRELYDEVTNRPAGLKKLKWSGNSFLEELSKLKIEEKTLEKYEKLNKPFVAVLNFRRNIVKIIDDFFTNILKELRNYYRWNIATYKDYKINHCIYDKFVFYESFLPSCTYRAIRIKQMKKHNQQYGDKVNIKLLSRYLNDDVCFVIKKFL